jgi:hypothetical protein
MKKFLLLFSVAIAFSSCQDDVKFNNPGMQGLKDDVLWNANDVRAYVSATGALTINAYTEFEILTMQTTSVNPNTYTLGTSDSDKVTFEYTLSGNTTTYLTGVGIGSGEIKITEYDSVNATITGTFKFNAMNVDGNPLGGPILNFQYGAFYKVQIFPAQ